MATIGKQLMSIVCIGIILVAGAVGCRRGTGTEVDAGWQGVKAQPNSVEAHLQLAKAYYQAEKYNDAYIHAKRAFELDPGSFEAAYELGRICLKLTAPEDGQQWIDKALKINPQSAEAYELRGRLTMASGKPEEAVSDFRRALQIDPQLPVAYLNLVTAYKAAGNKGAALSAAAQAVAVSPDEAAAHFAYGDILELADRQEEAEEQYRTAIKLQDDFAPAKLRLATILTSQKRHLQEARQLAKEAQRIDPGDGTAEAIAAWALVLMGEEHQGLTELQHAARSHPFNHIIWLRFAQALKKAGYDEQAKKAATVAIRVAPRRR